MNQVIDKLELPPYNPCISPKKPGVKVADIIRKSKTGYPKFVKIKDDEYRGKTSIAFEESSSDEGSDRQMDFTSGEGKLKRGGLRVIEQFIIFNIF